MINYLLLLLIIVLIVRWYFGTEKMYKDIVKTEMKLLPVKMDQYIKESDLSSLPEIVKNYLIKAEVIGKPRVKYFYVDMEGEMKLDRDKEFAPVKARQYNFIDSGTRVFYITMNYNKIPISGIHHYYSDDAFMKIKILDLIKVVDKSGPKMQKAETVTYFNDLCIMAPGALIEENITWEVLSDRVVKATLRKHGNEVSGILEFNNDGMLRNFASDDRLAFDSNGVYENIQWSTPMNSFEKVGEYFLANEGEAIWHYPDYKFSYIRLKIKDVKVNQ